MAFRTILSAVVAARRDDLNNLWNELFSSGPGTFSIPMRPAGSQGPATHYGFNAAGTKPAQADVMTALGDGTLPTEIWADGEPTGVAPAWGQGNLPNQQQAQAMIGGANLDIGNMAGGGNPDRHWKGFVEQGLQLEIITE